MEENPGHTFFKFIIDYWSQIAVIITILVGGIGYLLKIGFDWDLKKREIKYSMIFTKRSQSLESFIYQVLEYQRFFEELSYYEVGSQKFKSKELDGMIDEYRVPYLKSYTVLNIYTETKHKQIIEDIKSEFKNNRDHLSKLHFSNLSQNEGYCADDYVIAIENNGKKINVLIEKLISSTGYGKVVIK